MLRFIFGDSTLWFWRRPRASAFTCDCSAFVYHVYPCRIRSLVLSLSLYSVTPLFGFGGAQEQALLLVLVLAFVYHVYPCRTRSIVMRSSLCLSLRCPRAALALWLLGARPSLGGSIPRRVGTYFVSSSSLLFVSTLHWTSPTTCTLLVVLGHAWVALSCLFLPSVLVVVWLYGFLCRSRQIAAQKFMGGI